MITKRVSFFIIFLITFIAAVHGDEPRETDDFIPAITFERTCVNFGTINKNDGERDFEFRFANTGNAPLVLTYVHASCSCVRLKYPRQPIAPGDSSSISGTLNLNTIHEQDFRRNILVRSNALSSQARLFLIGRITDTDSIVKK